VKVRQYIFISTISVYADTSKAGMDETTPLLQYQGEDAMKETIQSAGRLYGQLKAYSEAEAERQFPGIATIIRPGLIVGPRDTSDRFSYWPVRIDRGGEVLAPGDGNDAVQIIDGRDIAEWTIRMAETRATGIYNATGPATTLTMKQMLEGIRAANKSNATFTWVPAAFLQQHQVRGWSDMPVWVAPSPQNAGFARVSIARALAKGLTFRPLEVTARETLEWYKSPASGRPAIPATGIRPEREKEVLAAWHARG
jgi:2'-hydroxyisoflavone reductase